MGTTPGKPPVLLDPRERSSLLERDAELALVDRLLDNALRAAGRCCCSRGRPASARRAC